MNNIELRWLVKDGVSTLQYRKQYDRTVYAGSAPGYHMKEIVWGEWTNIPVVQGVE